MNYIQEEVLDSTVLGLQQQKGRQEFVEEHKEEWLEIGESLRDQRIDLGITVTEMSRLLGTSTTRIRKFEKGLPVLMSKHLEASYKLALEFTKTQQEEDKCNEMLWEEELENSTEDYSKWDVQINHIRLIHNGGDLYFLHLVTESDTHIHIQDITELKWAHMVARNKFAKYLDVPIILQMENGEEVELNKDTVA